VTVSLDLEDQPQHAVSGRMLGAHVDDDALAWISVAGGLDDVVPVLAAGDDERFGFRHQL